ncbi:MAG: UvrD-helicase domain-containing protein [Eubacteriales bacterium]
MDFNKLNSAQKEAVTASSGATLVLAGAGSGKTRVLTYRAAYLIEKGVLPYHILAVTFTNKAAAEMRERINTLVGSKGMWIGTFHSICLRILRIDSDKIGYSSGFSIYDEGDVLSLVASCQKNLGFSEDYINKKAARKIISDAKNKGKTPDELLSESASQIEEDIAKIYKEYEKAMKKNAAFDFDDLLLKTRQLLDNEEVLKKYSSKFEHILVDEYQDTNLVQYDILKKLSSFHKNIFVVGDDDQSIYGFRGADIRNILEFEKDFSSAKIVRLEQNYRSHQRILDVANSVIKNNPSRKGKTLFSELELLSPPVEFECENEFKEAEFIADTVSMHLQQGVLPNEIAVMYRTNMQSRVIEAQIKSRGIKYRVYGGFGFYQRSEIKDLLAYLNLILNTSSNVSFIRASGSPKRGIGAKSLGTLSDEATLKDISMFEAGQNASSILPNKSAATVLSFVSLVEGFREKLSSLSISEFVDTVLKESGLIASYEKEGTPEAKNRIDNLLEFLNGAYTFEQQNEGATLYDFMYESALISELDDMGEKEESISLLTLHSAKGLEFDVVVLAGMQEGILPHAASLSEEKVDEERRLCYVGITRAKKYLYMTWGHMRTTYGTMGGYKSYSRSRFLDEVPDKMIDKKSAPKFKPHFIKEPKIKQNFFQYHSQKLPQAVLKEGICVGAHVNHSKFGDGVVVKVSGEGKETIAVVDFDSVGQKKIFTAFAPLAVIDY